MVISYYGNRVGDPNVPQEDRQAIAHVENTIRKWGKYIVVYRQENADLVLLVRKGRTAMITPQVGIGTHGGIDIPARRGGIETGGNDTRRTSKQIGLNAEAGQPNDMIAVYDAALGTDSAPLWRASMRDGLNPPGMKLVQEFRRVVEQSAKHP